MTPSRFPSCQVIGGLVGMATLAVEHARRKHAAQLAAIFSELLHTVSWLRCRLTFESPSNAEFDLQEYFKTVKIALHGFYIEARSFSTPPNQRSAWNTEQVELTRVLGVRTLVLSLFIAGT